MKPETIKIIYWVLLVLLCLSTLADGLGGVTMAQQGVDAMNHVGYPPYLMPLFGTLKILAVIALLQTKYQRIKEWVYAGLTFTFVGAAYAHFAVKDPVSQTIPPIIALAFMMVVYRFWKQYERIKTNA